jgi:hypothetical protein
LKRTILILLFFALLANTFSRSFVLADYLVNIKSYREKCINKTKPMMHCNGKCQVAKKIKSQEGDRSREGSEMPKFNQPEIVLSSKSFFPTIDIISDNIIPFYTFIISFSSNYIGSIFHPPGLRL